ncbi:MAG: hypothetical protein AB7I50_21135 [Vicinamibacterales bacterium]
MFGGLLTAPKDLHAETRSFAIDYFSQASYSQDNDCPGGINPPTRDIFRSKLEELGKTPAEVEQLLSDYAEGGMKGTRVRNLVGNRAIVNGQPVNAFAHPLAVKDPNIKTVVGKFAYGFDLDGKTGPNSFIEPITKEAGIDNELFRAMGCIEQFRGTHSFRPTFWDFIWGSMRAAGSPAWLISITGDDLSKNGPVTITFDRALEALVISSNGPATPDVTYRADPDPRSHHVLKGEIKDGVVTVTEPGYLKLLLDPLSFPHFVLHDTHLRLTLLPNGNADGFIGGYQPWRDFYFAVASGGLSFEGNIISDTIGAYYALRKLADGLPNAQTGENDAISATYRIETVSAFVIPPQGGVQKTASNR